METAKQWVALIDNDEDDYLYWQHGFSSWASHLELRWFDSANAYLSDITLGKSKPAALVLDGVVPRGDEIKWLSTLMIHPGSQQVSIIMLSQEFEAERHQAYMTLGIADHLIKPSNNEELKATVLKVSSHVSARIHQ